MPPYVKGGSKEKMLNIKDALTLRQLAEHISREWKDQLNFELVDQQGYLTAEFIVNGRYFSSAHLVDDGDEVTIIPYIGGG